MDSESSEPARPARTVEEAAKTPTPTLTDAQHSALSHAFAEAPARLWQRLKQFFLIDIALPLGWCPFCHGEYAISNYLPQWKDIAHAEGYNPDCEAREFEVYRWTDASGRKPHYQALDRRLMRSALFYVPPSVHPHPDAVTVGRRWQEGGSLPKEA